MTDTTSGDDIDGLDRSMATLNTTAEKVGDTLSNVFARGIVSGKSFDDILRGIGQRFIDIGLNAALKPLNSLVGNLFSGIANSVTGAFTGSAGGVTAFADGGVVASPTYFPMAGDMGLMGEAGAEAIMPLSRGPDGKLGVRSGGAGSTVNVSITTPDADSFRRSQAQVTASLARAVARGQRGL